MAERGGPLWRTRGAGVAAAVAVGLTLGGLGVAGATITTGERPTFRAIEPCRLVDTRAASQVGTRSTPLGPGETYRLVVRGTQGNCTLPGGAASLAGNVTVTGGTAQSYLTLFPDGVQRPSTSNLNWLAGQPPTPNLVTVGIGTGGAVNIYNNLGTVDLIIDVVGYYEDHTHDDRYYTEAEADARFAAADHNHDARYYTEAETDAQFVRHGDVTTSQGGSGWRANADAPSTVLAYASTTVVSGDGGVQQAIVGPITTGGVSYRPTSVQYCLDSVSGGGRVDRVALWRYTQQLSEIEIADGTDRTAAGCYSLPLTTTLTTDRGFDLFVQLDGGDAARVALGPVNVVWSPVQP